MPVLKNFGRAADGGAGLKRDKQQARPDADHAFRSGTAIGNAVPRPLDAAGPALDLCDLAAAAEAAGPPVAQVFLAVRARSRRNGRERGDGQGNGENNLRHDGLLLDRLC